MKVQKKIKNWISVAGASVILIGSILLGSLPVNADAATTSLSLSPSVQTVSNGSNITLSLGLNTGVDPINAVQTVISYPAARFSLVKAVAGSKFGTFVDTPKNGALEITAGSTQPLTSTSTITAATITFRAKTSSNTSFKLANICPAGDYAVTCSAAYDSNGNNNVLVKVASPARATVRLSAKQVSSATHVSDHVIDVLILLFIVICAIYIKFNLSTRKKL